MGLDFLKLFSILSIVFLFIVGCSLLRFGINYSFDTDCNHLLQFVAYFDHYYLLISSDLNFGLLEFMLPLTLVLVLADLFLLVISQHPYLFDCAS